MDTETPIVFLVQYDNWEDLHECDSMGEYIEGYGDDVRLNKLIFEVPDNEPQFKPFDKVLVRNDNEEIWQPRLYEMYSNRIEKHYCQDCLGYLQCIPYAGNESLVSTTNNPK